METSDTVDSDLSRRLVLASGSRYRARVLADAGMIPRTIPPDVDERALDHMLDNSTPEQHALVLAEAKAMSVAAVVKDSIVIGADQLGVCDRAGDQVILHKRDNVDDAVAQLMMMSGTTHRLVNGLVVVDTSTGNLRSGIDVMQITMRRFTRVEALRYVEAFRPFDSAGSYRIEDQEQMVPEERLVTDVAGEDPSGVLGMPLPLLHRLLRSL